MDSQIPAWEKIQKEGEFHSYCNGGCITYVELKEAPFGIQRDLMSSWKLQQKLGCIILALISRKMSAKNAGRVEHSILAQYAKVSI